MKKPYFIPVLAACAWLAACSVTPSDRRIFNADDEFAKLDTPNVSSVEQSLHESAQEALRAGENGKALSLYSQLVDRDPKRVDYQFGLAESLRRAGESQAAADAYGRVLAEQPDHLDAMEGQALAVMALGNTEEAARQFKAVLGKDPARWRTLNALGILFVIKQLPDDGMAYFNEALKHGGHPSVKNNIGLVQAMQRDYDAAIETLRAASKQATGESRQQIDMNLALVYGLSGNGEAAKQVAEKYLSEAALTNNLGLYAYLADDEELAKSYLNMALTGSPVYYKRAWSNLEIIASEGKQPKGFGSPTEKRITFGE